MVGFPHPEDVVGTCTTYLVTVSPSNGTIKLAHFSVKEFLVVSESVHWYQLTKNGGHMDIANRALDDLLDKTEVLTEEAVHGLPLLKYAAAHWSRHFSELTDSDAKFWDLEKKIHRLFEERIVYLNWRRVARDNFSMSSWDRGLFSFEPPIYLACGMGMQNVVERLLSQGANACTELGLSTVGVAALNGHLTLVKLLLGNIGVSAKIASEIASYIDLNNVPHEEVEDLLDLLLSTKVLYDKTANGCVLLNEDFVSAIAENERSGRRLMCLLLDRQDKLEVPVTESVLDAALCNRDGGETMRVLLDRRRKGIQITEGLMESVAADSRYTPDISELILQRWGATVPLNQKIVKEFVRRAPAKVMELLLQIRGHEIQITEELVDAAAANGDHEVFRLLWERVSGIEITSKTWQRIIIWGSKGLERMEIALAKCPQRYFLENEIILKVARCSYGLPLMRMLLDKREAGLVVFDVSEATMIAAASNSNCPQQMMELVINNADSEIPVNEKILSSAIGNVRASESALEYLLELEQNLPITEEVLVSAAAATAVPFYQRKRVLKFIFNKFPDAPMTDRVFKAAGHMSGVLLSLWLKRGRHIQDCQLIGRLLGQGIVSLQELTKLFDEGLVEMDDNLVDAVGTQNALIMALEGYGAMEKLLDLRRNDITVTEEVVLRALDEVCVDGQAFKMLTDRLGSVVPVTEKILEKAFLKDQSILLDLLLKEERNWNLQKVWDAIWRNHGYFLRDIVGGANALLKYGEFDVSQTLVEFLPRHEEDGFSNKDLDELVNLCAGRDISAPAMEMISVISFKWGDARTIRVFIDRLSSAVPMTEKVWDALWLNDGFSFQQKAIISNILLEYGEFDISQILLEFLPLREEKGVFSDEEIDELVNLCVGQDISAPATEMLIEILFEYGNANSIMKFVKRKPTVQLTDGLIQRADRNERAYKKVLMPFLYSKRAADQNINNAEAKTEAEED